ncbi:hypothetical protein L905_18000 [Agrobacterium sp. TS43]|uniref:hypothetical protein n=1 Tax=Agrobacterium TaxID=357 RepID=UPI00035C2CD2|nr:MULTISPECIES: hypothetical protein [Agrobacterium]EPR21329.1 hypothetical protein L902_27150 [Agrobacterium radiobacter DSM 30147]KDR90670.1 hypothetical protein K538_19405 [Agrobacterium tumefaciens GW4]KVK47359.1 hypothetical protein L904_07035 [Agrobacterium sp. LY4]KVK47902.1 hypothetical protein L903_07045 [Agrobacterium sp. JL28]KVK66187.1 hypothetical protein L905_18000 [Agrobacterium sp. TS43]
MKQFQRESISRGKTDALDLNRETAAEITDGMNRVVLMIVELAVTWWVDGFEGKRLPISMLFKHAQENQTKS